MYNRFCQSLKEDQTPGYANQSPYMEHYLRRDEGQLREVYDKPNPEVIMETEVVISTGVLVS